VAAVRTAAAGHDLILSCHDLPSERNVFQGLLEAYKNKLLPVSELEESVDRIEKLKAKRPKRFAGEPGADPEGEKLADDVARRGTRVFQDPQHLLPLSSPLRQNAGIVFPQLSSFAPKIMIERPFENEKQFFADRLKNSGTPPPVEVYPIEPGETDIARCATLARQKPAIIFFCFDAHLYPAEKTLLTTLQQATQKLIVVLMRDPYDKDFLRPQDTALTAFGFRKCQIEAVLGRIFDFGNETP
jgi:beta-glucosidase-like glycosyl hydrolase